MASLDRGFRGLEGNYTVTLTCGVEIPQGPAATEVSSEQLVFDSTRGSGTATCMS